jgi:hypothetical protein
MRLPAPATVISVAALVVALGGTSYAALKVGSANVRNNSLKSVDVRNNSLKSVDVANGTLTKADFAAGALTSTPGPAGPPGPKGDAGVPGTKGDKGDAGAPATEHWAAINDNGTASRSKGLVDVDPGGGTGGYVLRFDRNVRPCVYTATLGGSIANPAGQISVAFSETDENVLFVTTRDAGGTGANSEFMLVVHC